MELEGVFHTIMYSIGGIAMSYPIIAAGLSGLQIFDSTRFQDRIRSEEELIQIVIEESTKLGIDHENLDVYQQGHQSGRDNSRYYIAIDINRNYFTRNGVRHELAHIANGDVDKDFSYLRYFLIEEPRATIYGTLGIRL